MEQWSLAETEHRLIQSVSELTEAELRLREARQAETNAEIVYQRAYRHAMLSADCPRVERGGATVAERDAHVQSVCHAEWQAYRLAHTACKSAEDHSRTVRDVVSTVQSIAGLVKATFGAAGQVEW